MSCKTKCVKCKYEDQNNRLSHDNPNNPERYEGRAIWCKKLKEYIGPNRSQNEYCPHFVQY
ncbi:hypothetical protein IMCC3317_09270 [Kordia antarctica]|uniref:Uncharacterized protein n=1 Tax=Kordia antarctica TaxID=1218801 RepID=A0A7L4ZGM2_9FLAO|nr:hypothetical protein IMCC3317_09270 [Kordia antarctica]